MHSCTQVRPATQMGVITPSSPLTARVAAFHSHPSRALRTVPVYASQSLMGDPLLVLANTLLAGSDDSMCGHQAQP